MRRSEGKIGVSFRFSLNEGLIIKNEFETAMINEPSVFKPLKFYCTVDLVQISLGNEFSVTINTVLLHTALHYHPFIGLK